MDPLMSATLATHHQSMPRPRRPRRHRAGVETLPDGWEWDGLAWSALPTAPVCADPPPRKAVVRQRLATVLRRVADTVDADRHVRQVARTSG